jgi:hypothetical protein
MDDKIYVKYLGGDLSVSGRQTSGFLLLTPEAISFQGRQWKRFKGYSLSEELLRIPIEKIEDVEVSKTTECSSMGLVYPRIPLTPIRLSDNFKSEHNMVKITYRDDENILQHPLFETNKAESLARVLYGIRIRNKKQEKVRSVTLFLD